MPRPRTPLAKAKATGQDNYHAERFKNRKEPRGLPPVGPPPEFFTIEQAKIWNQFKRELFWLNGSHRAILEIACTVRAKLWAGEDCNAASLTMLRQCLGMLGATPVDASKIQAADEDDENDPAQKYFH